MLTITGINAVCDFRIDWVTFPGVHNHAGSNKNMLLTVVQSKSSMTDQFRKGKQYFDIDTQKTLSLKY